MPVREILQLGNPTLREKCTDVTSYRTTALTDLVGDLRATLHDFRDRNGFGRGIAAPQIGVTERVIFIHVDEPLALVNPVVTRHSRKRMTMWDDCFSLPNLLVKVNRHVSMEIRYCDTDGKAHTLSAEGGLSELLQHEIDHLDGILAIDRAVDSKHIVLKSEYEKWWKERGNAGVSL